MQRLPVVRPPELIAETFHRRLTSGRNRALLVSARGPDGESIDCVVKVPGLMENAALHPVPSLVEWVAASLARELGVVVPRALLVRITLEFAQSVSDASVATGLSNSVGLVFGSEFIQGASMLRGDLLDGSLRRSGETLLAFDVFIHNIDRRIRNPNLFHTRESLVAFDHGEAFSFLWPVIGGSDPVTDPLRSVVLDHACTSLVRRRTPSTFEFFRNALAKLEDSRLAAIVDSTPAEWRTGPASGKLEQIIETLQKRRDAVDSWLPSVEACI